MAIKGQKNQLTPEKKKRLKAYIVEMKSRGLVIPDSVKEILEFNEKPWSVDPNGYFVKSDGTLYNPSVSQESFIKSDARFTLFAGGRGSGKSGAGAQKALKKIKEGKSGSIFNPDYENFKISTWAEFKEWIPWDHVVPAHQYRQAEEFDPGRPFTLVFDNGAKVYCKGVKDPGSARGSNVNWLWYDEAGRDEDGLSWKVAIASVRVGENPQAWATATARGRSHWMYEFFVEQKFPPDVLEALEEISKRAW